MKRIVIVFVLLVAAFSTALFVKVRQSRLELTKAAGGSAIAEGIRTDVAARIGARILAIHKEEGDAVKAGELLVELDCREQDALHQAARANLAAAEKRAQAAHSQGDAALGQVTAAEATAGAAGAQREALAANRDVSVRQAERLARLRGEGGTTENDLDRATSQVSQLQEQLKALDKQAMAAAGQARAARSQAEAAREQAEAAVIAIQAAQAELQRAEALRSECTLLAPSDGVVELRSYEPGEVAMPGARVLSLVRFDPIEATFYLPNRELAAVAAGRSVTAEADAWPGQSFEGKIIRVATEAEFTPRNVQTREDRDRLVYAVTVRLPNPERKLRPGMPLEVRVQGGAQP